MRTILFASNSLPNGVVQLTGVKDDLSNVGEILVAMKLLPAPALKRQGKPRYFEYNPLTSARTQKSLQPKLKQIGLNFSGDDCIYI